MNALVLLALLFAAPPDDPIIDPPPNLGDVPPVKNVPRVSFNIEDFHVYDESQNLHGLPLLSKVYVNAPDDDFLKRITKFGDKLAGMKEFTVINTGPRKESKGIIFLFEDKGATIKGLNALLKEGYKACPIVIYDDVEMIVPNEIVVYVQPSAKKGDYLKRLNKVAEGKFEITELSDKTFVVTIKELVNPSNVIVLSNLISQDKFWVKWAMPAYVPLNGYIVATATVETPSYTNLGQERMLKIDISVFDPKIVVKLDTLPQMGPTLTPFPNAGDGWLDVKPQEIKETKTATKRVYTVSYPFRYLQYGSFIFQPIAISYEKDGKLAQVKTNPCRFVAKSVILGTDIDDLQPESYMPDVAMAPAIEPAMSKEECISVLFGDAKVLVSGVFGGIGGILLLFWAAGLIPLLSSLFDNNPDEYLWEYLDACLDLDFEDWRADYGTVSSRLNDVLVRDFGVSLYALTPEHCEGHFAELLNELNKLYMPPEHVEADVSIMFKALSHFCHVRTGPNMLSSMRVQ